MLLCPLLAAYIFMVSTVMADIGIAYKVMPHIGIGGAGPILVQLSTLWAITNMS